MFNFFSRKSQPIDLWFETDVHCHVIPGVDDGSPDIATSVQLVEALQGWGIKRIIASPHVTQDTFENTPEILDAALKDLTDELHSRGNNINISHSAEYRLDDFFISQLANGNLRPYPGDYLLVENSFLNEPYNLDSVLFDLKVKGFQPVMAHPERFAYYHRRGDRYKQLHDGGAMFQVNVLSLAGYYGKEVRQVAEQLIERGYVDFLGTDLHGSRHVITINEYLASKDALKHRKSLEGKLLNDTL